MKAEDYIWLAAFVLWVPQILMLLHILKTRLHKERKSSKETVMMLAPLMVLCFILGNTGLLGAVAGLALLMYADVNWGQWLFTLVIPTVAGVIIVKATREPTV